MYILKEGTTGLEGTADADLAAIRDGLAKTGFVVKTKAVHDQDVQTAIDDAFSKRNKQIEETILEVTSVPKNSDEKYFDYLKRAVPLKLAELATTKAELERVKREGIDPKGLAKELQDQLDALKTNHKREKDDLQGRITTFENQNFAANIDRDIQKAVDKLRPMLKDMDATIAQDVIERRIQRFKNENIAKQIEGGIVIFNGPDGKTRRNDTSAQPAGVEEIIGPYFADLIDEGRKASGGGSGPAGKLENGVPVTKEGKKDWKAYKLPEAVKTQVDVMKLLKETHKMSEDTKEFSEAFMTLTKPEGKAPLPVK